MNKLLHSSRHKSLGGILLGGLLAVGLFLAGLVTLWYGNALNGDFKVCRLPIMIAQRTNEVAQRDGRHVILPFGVELRAVRVYESCPPMALLESENWRAVADYRPLAVPGATEMIGTYLVEVDSLIMDALPAGDSFRQFRRKGAMPAAYVRVTDTGSNKFYQGWIYTGQTTQLPQNLPLAGTDVLTLCQPAVEHFEADVVLHRNNGTRDTLQLKSLEPVRRGRFKFCLADFDREQGKWADNCLIEIDPIPSPWTILLGFCLLIGGIRYFVKMLRYMQERKIRRRMLGRPVTQ